METEQKIVPAENLPEGWEWRLFDDGSGGLYSPENNKVVEVDFATSEYRREGEWHFMSGYPYETISSGEFMDSMEKSVRSKLERESKVLEQLDTSVPAETLSPAKMALNEPGIFDEGIDCIETSTYMSMLTDRVNANYVEYIDSLRGINGESITDYSAEIATISEAHYYITTCHNFHFSELDYLLQFKNPLKVVAEAFDENRDEGHSNIMWKIFHEQEALKSGRHAPAFDASSEPGVPTAEALKQELFDRLDKNLSDYRDTMMSNSKQFVYDMAEDIAVKFAAREYMKTGYDYKTGEVEFFLQFQNPLALVVDNWPSTLDGLIDMTIVISGIFEDKSSHGHYALVVDADNPTAKEKGRGPESTENNPS